MGSVHAVSPDPALKLGSSDASSRATLPFRANFTWTLSGMITYAACQWGMLAIMARLGSPKMLGQFALGLAVSAPVMLLANLELRFILATDARREYRFRDYFGLRLLTSFIALVVIAALALAMGDGEGTTAAIAGLGVFKAVEALSDLLYGLFQQRSRNDLMGRSLMLRGPLSLAALAGGVAGTGRLLPGIAAMSATGILVYLLHDLPAARTLLKGAGSVPAESCRPRWEGPVLGRLALLAAPLGAVTMLFSLNTNLPSLLLQRLSDLSTVGLYAALLSLMTAGHILVNAMGHTACRSLSVYHAGGDARRFSRLLGGMVIAAGLIGGGGLAAAVIWGRPLLGLLFGPAYAKEAPALQWILAAGAVAYVASAFSYAMIASRRLRIQPVILLVSIAVTLALGLLLIPRLGLAGAAVSLLGSSLVQLVANAAVMTRVVARLNGGTA